MPSKKTKECPFCWEVILAVAKKCKHCWEFLNKDLVPQKKKGWIYYWLKSLMRLLVAIGILTVIGIISNYFFSQKMLEQEREQASDQVVDNMINSAIENLKEEEENDNVDDYWLDKETLISLRKERIDETNKSFIEDWTDLRFEYVSFEEMNAYSDDFVDKSYRDNLAQPFKNVDLKKIVYKKNNWEIVEERNL